MRTFIDTVHHGHHTGGGIYNDIIVLNNGMVIRISEDAVCVYNDHTDDDDGKAAAMVGMVPSAEEDEAQEPVFKAITASMLKNLFIDLPPTTDWEQSHNYAAPELAVYAPEIADMVNECNNGFSEHYNVKGNEHKIIHERLVMDYNWTIRAAKELQDRIIRAGLLRHVAVPAKSSGPIDAELMYNAMQAFFETNVNELCGMYFTEDLELEDCERESFIVKAGDYYIGRDTIGDKLTVYVSVKPKENDYASIVERLNTNYDAVAGPYEQWAELFFDNAEMMVNDEDGTVTFVVSMEQ